MQRLYGPSWERVTRHREMRGADKCLSPCPCNIIFQKKPAPHAHPICPTQTRRWWCWAGGGGRASFAFLSESSSNVVRVHTHRPTWRAQGSFAARKQQSPVTWPWHQRDRGAQARPHSSQGSSSPRTPCH